MVQLIRRGRTVIKYLFKYVFYATSLKVLSSTEATLELGGKTLMRLYINLRIILGTNLMSQCFLICFRSAIGNYSSFLQVFDNP